jgi:RND family efflux transporter MFP subunit
MGDQQSLNVVGRNPVHKAIWPGLLVGVLGAGFIAGAWFERREAVSASSSRPRTPLYYVDPMHPAYRSDKPGKAPDCGMDLVAIYDEGEGAAGGTARLGREMQEFAGIRVVEVEKAAGTGSLRLFGRVAADETGLFRINIGTDGVIREVAAVTTGSRVEKGQWLATISTPEARGPIQTYLVARDVLARAKDAGEGASSTDLAAAALQQTIDRLLTLGMSSAQIEEIARTRQVPTAIRILAPANGFVVMRNASVGQTLGRGDEVFRITAFDRVWVLASAFGADAQYVKPGAVAEVSVPGRATTLRAHVSRDVPPQFDANSQSATVRLDVDNTDDVLRPDMFVDVTLLVAMPPAIAVPADAIVDSGHMRTVFVEKSAGVFEPREVETGRRADGRVEILKGLAAGERVVVAGTFVVDAERRVRGGAVGVQALP